MTLAADQLRDIAQVAIVRISRHIETEQSPDPDNPIDFARIQELASVATRIAETFGVVAHGPQD